jgi:hypothetical protein
MSRYNVSSIDLAPIDGIHLGTGDQQRRDWVVDPVSVPPPGNLRFTGADTEYTSMLFQLDALVVPNWFGVVVPSAMSNPYVDFSTPNIFFHPMPGQAGYVDSGYLSKSGKWPELFYYMDELGIQVDNGGPKQIVIMPFLTSAATNTGIFAANWFDIVNDILTLVQNQMAGVDAGNPVQASQVVVSSFSSGIVYSDAFRKNAPGLIALLYEVWDLDGLFSTSSGLSQALKTNSDFDVIQYDQVDSNNQIAFHVPLRRWAGYPARLTSPYEVHGNIKSFMFLHACTESNVNNS